MFLQRDAPEQPIALPVLGKVNEGDEVSPGDGINESVKLLRTYDRCLLTTEAIGNWRNVTRTKNETP